MGPDRASLRPRDVLRLLDAAFEAVVSAPGIAWTAILGGVPVAVVAMVLVYDASAHAAGWPVLVRLAGLGAIAGLLRYLAGGAAVRQVLAGAYGEATSPGRALGEALRRGPSLMAAGALGVLVVAASGLAGFLPLLGLGGVFLAVPLTVTRDASPWGALGATRALLGGRAGRSLGLTVLWLVGILALALNLGGLVMLGLYLGAHLFGLDVAYLASVLSPGNPVFFPAAISVAFVLLEPVRWASLALLVVDGRVRRDAMDLEAALADLPPVDRGRRRGAAALVLLLSLAGASAARAQVPADAAGTPRARLLADARWAAAEGAEVDPKAVARLVASVHGQGPALGALASEVEADLGRGDAAAAGRRLSLALAPMAEAARVRHQATPGHRAGATAGDPRALARRILAGPAFRSVRVHPGKADAPGWLDRFFAWVRKTLRHLLDHPHKATSQHDLHLLPVALTWLLWGALLLVVFALVALFVTRALGGRGQGGDDADPGDAPGETARPAPRPGTALADALARSPDAWLAEADQAAAAGAHREAVRLGYLALLAALHRAQAIDYDRARTNGDLVRGFRGEGLARETFADVTGRFERAWYGLAEVTEDGYQLVRESARTVVHAVGGVGLG